MTFLAAVIQTLIKMAVVGVFAFGGIQLGKHLRDKKDRKEANEK